MIRLILALVMAAALPAWAQQNRPQQQQRQGPERELTIQNQSSRAITELYASSTEDSEWGADHLGNNTLPAGRNFRIRLGRTSQCTFDVRVVYDDGSSEETRNHNACRQRQLAFDGSNATGGQAAGEEHSFELANRHARTVYEVFVSPDDDWGEDLLGSDTLSPNGTATISYRGDCRIRLRIVFDNDAAEERRDIDVCAQPSVTVGPGWTTVEDLAGFTPGSAAGSGGQAGGGSADRFTLVNRSGKGILILYVFPDGADDRGEDRLGSDIIPDGGRFTVRLNRGGQCRFTVHVVYEGPDADEERSGIDLCNTSEVVVAPGWVAAPTQGIGRIRNAGGLPIVELYADPAGAPRGPDRLGAQIVGVGGTFELAPPVEGECRYHVTGVFRDGRESGTDADLCSGQEVILQ